MLDYNGGMSPNEIKMFTDLGMKDLIYAPISILGLYAIAVERAFVENRTGPAVEALRRAMIHMRAGKFRGNEEFENLIVYT